MRHLGTIDKKKKLKRTSKNTAAYFWSFHKKKWDSGTFQWQRSAIIWRESKTFPCISTPRKNPIQHMLH